MTIQIGINPLTWTNDDLPTLGADIPLTKCLKEGKQSGYSGFELGNKFPRESEALNSILKSHDLKLVSGWYSGQLLQHSIDEEILAIDAHLQLLKNGGSKVMVYCEVGGCIHGQRNTPLSKRPILNENALIEYSSRLSQLADHCLSQGVQLAYHHHMGTVIETPSEIDILMQNTSHSLGLLLDTGHLTFAGGDPLEVYLKFHERIIHVHAKDIRKVLLDDAKNRDLSFLNSVLNGVFTIPGDGCIDYLSLFKAMKNKNYNGWIVVEAEQDPTIAPSLTYAKSAYKNIVCLAEKANWDIN